MDINDMVTAGNQLFAVGSVVMTTVDGGVWSVHTRTLQQPGVNNHSYNNTPVSGEVWDEIQYYDFQSVLRNQRFGVGGVMAAPANLASLVSHTTNTLRDAYSFNASGGIAVGENGTLVRYSSGQNAWTNVPSGTTVSLSGLVAAADNNVIVVGGGGTILRSANSGQSWGGVTSGTTENLNRVLYATGTGFNYFIAVGDNGVIRKSTNGTTWTVLTSGTTKRLMSIGYRTVGNVKLVAIAEDSTVLYSENHGTNWSAITVNTPHPILYGSPDGVTGYAQDGIRMTTSDGTNWSYTFPSVSGILGLGHGNGRFVALPGVNRMTSTDLVNWSIATTPHSHYAVTFGNGLLVSVGDGNSTLSNGFVSVSMDGSRWLPQKTPTQVYLNAVTHAQGKFVAVGANGTILTSTNGVNWANRTVGSTSDQLRGVAYGNGTFAAVGTGSLVRNSADGETWVAAGSGASLKSVTFAKGLFVAVGDNGAIRTSVNGSNWTTRTTSPSTFEFLYDVKYAGDRFVAVGEVSGSGAGAVVLHSLDGTNWTREVSNIPSQLWTAVAAAGQYVAASSSAGVIVSAPYQSAPLPTITSQPAPASQTVIAGTTVNYIVTATGTNLQYRWLNNGVPMSDGPGVSGSGTATLTLSGVDVLDASVYHVSVWNDDGSVLSQPVSLAVNGSPIITVHPVSVTTSNTFTTNFNLTAVGPGPFTYQWRRNGENLVDGGKISGATTSKLTLSNVAGTNEGAYDVIVSNAFGASDPSNPAQLLVRRPPTITQAPMAMNINEGQTISLSVQADGTLPLTYQWKRGGVNLSDGGRISGAMTPTLTITGAQVSDGGGYTVTITNAYNPAATSTSVYVSVLGAGALHPQFVFNGAGTTWDIAPAGDGRFLIGGDGSITFAGLTWSRLAKIDSNGIPTVTFATTNASRSTSGSIRTIAPQTDGQMLVGGSFAWGTNASNAYAVRLNADGVLDPTFQAAPALIVKKILALPGGKVLLGRTGLGFATSRVNRYEPNGALDGTFTEVVNANRELHGLARQSDGTLWMSGVFGLKKSTVNGTSPTGVATFAPFPEMFQVHVGPDDKIYYSDNNGQYFGRLLADGSRDLSFTNTINGHVSDMAFLPDGRLVIVGDFQTINAITNAYIALLENNGTTSTSFISPYTWVFGNSLNAIEMVADGSALVGGTVQVTLPTIQRYLQRVQVLSPASPGLTFAQWLAGQGLPVGQDGPGDDPDGDGLNNNFEFYFGSSPTNVASRTKPAEVNVETCGLDYPAITFIRIQTAMGVTLIPHASSDVEFTDSLGTVLHSVVDLGNGREQVTIRSAASVVTQPIQFLRIRLSVP